MILEEKIHRIFEGYYNQPEGQRKILINNEYYNKPVINDSKNIDSGFKNAIDAIKYQILELSKIPYYEFIEKFDKKHLIKQNFVYTGYAYNNIKYNILRSAPNDYSSHLIYLYPFYDSSSKVNGYTMQRNNIHSNELLELEKQKSVIIIAVNVSNMKDEKYIAGILWCQFNHILKMHYLTAEHLKDNS